MTLTFKQHFGIPENQSVEFLDIPLDSDLEVFIDPFLIANNRHVKIFNDVYSQAKKFLEKLNRDYIIPNDRAQGLIFLDNLHEPNEYHLGYSSSNNGAAISNNRAETIFAALRNNRFARENISITNEAHGVLLLVTGIGQDIMSDTLANICRDKFARFTTEQCTNHNIQISKFQRHYYSPLLGTWEHADFDLPSYKGKPIILLPSNILSSARSYVNHYNYFVAGNYIAKDILSGKIAVTNDGRYVKTMSNGTRHAIVKRIVETYSKPKEDLIDFVVEYSESFDKFVDYAKEHYPALDLTGL